MLLTLCKNVSDGLPQYKAAQGQSKSSGALKKTGQLSSTQNSDSQRCCEFVWGGFRVGIWSTPVELFADSRVGHLRLWANCRCWPQLLRSPQECHRATWTTGCLLEKSGTKNFCSPGQFLVKILVTAGISVCVLVISCSGDQASNYWYLKRAYRGREQIFKLKYVSIFCILSQLERACIYITKSLGSMMWLRFPLFSSVSYCIFFQC